MLNQRVIKSMLALLLIHHSLLLHQPDYFELAHDDTFIAKYIDNRSCASRLTALIKQALRSGAQNVPLSINLTPTLSPFIITTDTNT